jgi:hypothetical protein
MTKVICIVGLPGSGKTKVANDLCYLHTLFPDHPNRWGIPSTAIVVDDIKSLDQLPAPDECDLLIITDPYFCITSTRKTADAFLKLRYCGEVDWRFFPNEPEKCLLNVEHRADGRKVFEFIKQLSKVYEPETVFYKIWQNGSS